MPKQPETLEELRNKVYVKEITAPEELSIFVKYLFKALVLSKNTDNKTCVPYCNKYVLFTLQSHMLSF